MSVRTILHPAAVAGLLALLATPALAAEGGQSPYLKGYRDLFMGVVPPEPGFYFRDDVISYGGSADKVVLDGRAQFGLKASLVFEAASFTYVSDIKIFGGQYAFGVLPTLAYGDVRASLNGPQASLQAGDTKFAIGDMGISPIVLGWHGANHTFWNVGLGVLLPTGNYQSDRLANTSLHYFAIMPQAGFSYLDPMSGWDASIGAAYTFPFKNTATDYQSGEILHFDGALSKQITPAWRLGVVGYTMNQITGDSGSGAVLGPFRSQVYGFGPLAAYTLKVGARPVTMLVKWDHEFGAVDTFQGDTVTGSFNFKF